MSAAPAPEIYQLRFYVKGISPMIWRRLLVRSDSSQQETTAPNAKIYAPIKAGIP
jgi:hypothetical protein